MSGLQPIPRAALSWLLVAQALVIVPHLAHLPAWIILLWLGCAAWRVQILRMRATYPNRLARLALVLILLGFFVVVTAYLFDDSILMAVFSILPVTALLAAMIGLQQGASQARAWPTLRLAGTLLLQALPLMLLLFLLFPRMGPLWSLPMPSDKGVTGLSPSMSPGDIAELSQSDALVFRATFDGPAPPRAELYWRALTLQHFDGRRWSQLPDSGIAPVWFKRGEPWRYSIIMQPSQQPWLFALDVAQSDLPQARQRSDFRLQRARPVERPLLYQVSSWPQALREPAGSPRQLQAALQLPSRGEPRSRAWAAQLQREYPQRQALVAALLEHFNREPYVYTLRPPLLGEDNIDEFLFDSRRGFCAHYAGAMAFVLRAAGIPARVVAGYQGGELNPAGNYIQVRQFDAHAWVEYWQPEKGWISVDPTFQVAPERIELGLQEAVAGEQSFLENSPFSALRYRQLGWLNQLRMSWDNLNYGWQRWVLDYQAEQQLGLLQRWFGGFDGSARALALGAGGALLIGLLALMMFRPWQRPLDPAQRAYRTFEAMLARHGLHRQPGEGPQTFAIRAGRALPAQAAAIQAVADAFIAQRYAAQTLPATHLRQLLRRLRRALPWRSVRGK